MSSDGRHVVYLSELGGRRQYYLHTLDQWEAMPIRGTEHGGGELYPFFLS